MSTNSMSEEAMVLLKQLRQDSRFKEILDQMCRIPSPPLYKPYSRRADENNENYYTDLAYKAGEYDRTILIRRNLLNYKEDVVHDR